MSVFDAPPRLGNVRMAAVDGPAGSGKTTFAGRLTAALRALHVEVATVHTDDLLEGWGRPDKFWPLLRAWVVEPLAAGTPARHRVYDWHAGAFGPGWQELGYPEVLLVEGVTAAAKPWRPRLSCSVYVDADPELRLQRGIRRDGEALRAEWLEWRRHEKLHFAKDGTILHANLVVDGTPTAPHDPKKEFVALRG